MSERKESRFAEKMKEYLSITGKKISDLAKETGIPYTSLVSYINEGRQPTFSVVKRLIDKANISPEWLFLDEGKMLLNEELEERPLRYFEKILSEQYKLDPDKDFKDVDAILKQFKNIKLRKRLVRIAKAFDAETDIDTAIGWLSDAAFFLLSARSVLAMRYKS